MTTSTAVIGAPGRVLAGRYRLIDKLGQGGMGTVWRAEHLNLKSPVAVKLMDPKIVGEPGAVARFMREAQASAALRSVNVVQILDFGVDEGAPFMVLELLEGESLDQRLKREGVLTDEELAFVFRDVCRAIARAHAMGITHRDLKPANIFIVKEGDHELAKVLDFGIAKTSKGFGQTASLQTETGALLGTPFYMSPEQAEGDRGVDARSDLWSLGVIAYECVTGARPFSGDSLGKVLVAICTRPTPVPSERFDVPDGFDQWFLRAVERDPARRFQSAEQLVEALNEVLGVPLGDSGALPSTGRRKQPSSQDLGDGTLQLGKATTVGQFGLAESTDVANGKGSRLKWVIGPLLVLAALLTLFLWPRAETASREASSQPQPLGEEIQSQPSSETEAKASNETEAEPSDEIEATVALEPRPSPSSGVPAPAASRVVAVPVLSDPPPTPPRKSPTRKHGVKPKKEPPPVSSSTVQKPKPVDLGI